ncbi:peptidase associated/transthyretin-like domain-containing protein [Phaeocystidibacter luteus]|uniref:Carboxypeptidase-like regulatory domain-containing protein n=1 Tax=Phaeocystidibacter luteus TaxID=911197 RepID=A0A6N6RIM9_9FLAO|nr:hypothetical protein [Phaeocystidibacter luteus]KAB2814152.1 carboxypeptidase-like regulatory domain-containing protein [Phaeocystidibacter luteus]
MKLKHLFIPLLMLASVMSMAQQEQSQSRDTTKAQSRPDVIQVSGAIMTNDSLSQFVPNAVVYVKGRKATLAESGEDGFFSIAALPNDTIVFSHFSFESQKLWVPDTLEGKSYLSIVTLKWKAYEIAEIILYPWPRPENLQRELLAMNLPTTEMDIAQRNLAIQQLKERAEEMGYDAREIGNYVIKSQNYNLYNQGRYYGANGGAALLGRLTDPFAWNEFFKAIQRGDFSD